MKIEEAAAILAGIKNGLPKAITNAINRTAESTRAEIVRQASQTYDIKAADVRKTIKINRATVNNTVATVISEGRPIPLIKFKVAPSVPKKNPEILRASVKLSGGKPIETAFVTRLRSGHVGVFRRLGTARLPINQLYGPTVPSMLQDDNVSKNIEKHAHETFEKRLEHEVIRLLEGGNK